MTSVTLGMSNPVWTLPEGENYAIEFFAENRWMRRVEYGTVSYLKQVISAGHLVATTVRIVKVSRYPPHPAVAVVYYRKEEHP